jgi:hypothetical protein
VDVGDEQIRLAVIETARLLCGEVHATRERARHLVAESHARRLRMRDLRPVAGLAEQIGDSAEAGLARPVPANARLINQPPVSD